MCGTAVVGAADVAGKGRADDDDDNDDDDDALCCDPHAAAAHELHRTTAAAAARQEAAAIAAARYVKSVKRIASAAGQRYGAAFASKWPSVERVKRAHAKDDGDGASKPLRPGRVSANREELPARVGCCRVVEEEAVDMCVCARCMET